MFSDKLFTIGHIFCWIFISNLRFIPVLIMVKYISDMVFIIYSAPYKSKIQ